jgi:hypothetical protein
VVGGGNNAEKKSRNVEHVDETNLDEAAEKMGSGDAKAIILSSDQETILHWCAILCEC